MAAPRDQEGAMPELHGWIFDDTLDAGEHSSTPAQIYGHEGNDRLFGTAVGDLLDGGTGADRMYGWRGNDTYVVDNPDDYVEEAEFHYPTGDPSDTVYASISYTLPEFVENLSLMTNGGVINGTGNELENVIHGNQFANTLQGLDGNDLIVGHDGNDTLRGGNHDDELHGNDDHDTLEGGDGEDELFGGNDEDTLRGGAHDDTLDGGTGADRMEGGSGHDTYLVDNSADFLVELSNQGTDIAISTAANFTLGLYVEALVLDSAAGAINGTGSLDANTIVGNGSDNEIRGEAGNDLLKGGGGDDDLRGGNHNDELYGQGGNDDLRGDDGEDEMHGGADNDTYRVNSAGDEVIESADEGLDAVFVFTLDDYTLTANVENLNLITGTNGTGNGLANTIIGNLLDNRIDGAGGIDRMEGRQGDDTYVVDTANDVVIESDGNGDDTVLASAHYGLAAGVSVEHLATTDAAGTTSINLIGNALASSITGNNGVNILNGGGGADVLDGRGGLDTASYINNTGRVVVILGVNGAAGLGYELNSQGVLVSVDTLFNIEDALGSSFDDTLVGSAADHVLRGSLGGDTYFVHDAGVDIFENVNQGTDEVRASVSYALSAGAEIERFRTTDDTGTGAIDLTGNTRVNEITGNDGENRLDGGVNVSGSDTLRGRDGSDTYIVRNANDSIAEFGGEGADTVLADVSYELTDGADVESLRTTDDNGTAAINLAGNNTGNNVTGNNGDNVLNGAGGRDTLTGRGGADDFLFDSELGLDNVDTIADFAVGIDTIVLENDVFTALEPPKGLERDLTAAEFGIGTAAQDASDRIIYDSSTGALSYDRDGVGGTAAIQFATLSTGLALSNLDFLVV
jgi:Ca2+-binding RTX toxin-like protein